MSEIQTIAQGLRSLENLTAWDHKLPDFTQIRMQPLDQPDLLDYRFYRVSEISEGKAGQYRLAMANVISGLCTSNSRVIYLLSGTPEGVALYIGVAGKNRISDVGEMLKSSFEGNFLGAQLQDIKKDNADLANMFKQTKHIGLVTGVPSFNDEENNLDGEDFQGIERLVNSLSDTTWQLLIVAQPGSEEEIHQSLNEVYELSTQLSSQIKQSIQQSENTGWNKNITEGTSESHTTGKSVNDTRGTTKGVSESKGSSKDERGSSWSKGTNTSKGTSDSTSISTSTGSNSSETKGVNKSIAAGKSGGQSVALTRERIDKRIEQIQTHLNETQIDRFRQGLSKGMFRTAIYVCAPNQQTYDRLSRGVLSIFQGSKPAFTPLLVNKLQLNPSKQLGLSDFLDIRMLTTQQLGYNPSDAVINSIPKVGNDHIAAATWLNTKELSLIAGLPCLELPGLKLRKSVSFALNTADTSTGKTLKLGEVVQNGRVLKGKSVALSFNELNKHTFVTGVTGSGKTTTCMKLLLESQLPFVVIEPAKTEYRALYGQVQDIQYYSLGREDLTTFRLNPFELVSKHQNLTGHISMLKATMTAVFPMEASMPFMVEQAIIRAYEDKGWDIATNTNYLVDDPWQPESHVWPTFSDMIGKLDEVIAAAKIGKEFEEKYRGSLVSRLSSLTDGIKGVMINTPRSIDFHKMLDQKIVIELEELKDEEDKAFFMGLIISRLAECMKQRHRTDPNFRHMTLVEEAHRLLSRPEPGADGSQKLGVEMFANLLAEVRKYGECLIIADQIPNKLVADVIKNTNTKIIHKLHAADDRNTMGDTVGLDDKQKEFLAMLLPGETVIYSGGWHAAVRAKIDQLADTTAPEIPEEKIRECGIEQLWHNRNILFPELSRSHEWQSAQEFARFVQQGRMIINNLSAFAQKLEKKAHTNYMGPSVNQWIMRMHERLSELIRQFQYINNEKILNMLVTLFKDTNPKWYQKQKATQDIYYQTLIEFLNVLQKSTQDFFERLSNKQPNLERINQKKDFKSIFLGMTRI